MLKQNTTLESTTVGNMQAVDDTLKLFISALPHMQGLKGVSLCYRTSGPSADTSLVRALEQNTTLERFYLPWARNQPEIRAKIDHLFCTESWWSPTLGFRACRTTKLLVSYSCKVVECAGCSLLFPKRKERRSDSSINGFYETIGKAQTR